MQYSHYRARGSDHPKGGPHQHYCQHIKQNCCKSHDWVPALTIRSIDSATLGNFFFVTIANSKQHIFGVRSEEHTSELQSRFDLVCRLLLVKKKQILCTVRKQI